MGIHWRDFLAIRPASMSWQDNLRLIAPALLALIGFSLLGRFIDGLLVALGAYIVLFGAGQPGRRRLKVYLTVSGLMLAAVSLGVLAAGSLEFTILAYLLVAVVAVLMDILSGLGGPGPYFFVLMVGGGSTVGQGGASLGSILPYMVAGNALAIVFAMADVLYDRYGTERRAIAAARRAVEVLAHAAESKAAIGAATPATDEGVGTHLVAAAAAINRAWATFIAGAGRTDNVQARGVEQELRQVNRAYRTLYVRVVERRLCPSAATQPGRGSAGESLENVESLDSRDLRHVAVGEPSLGYRLAAEMTWPSAALITLARVSTGLVLASGITHLARNQHPFWATLVIVLVLSYQGSQERLVLRAFQRFIGTSVGIGIFAALITVHLGQGAYIGLLSALLWLVSRVTPRNYLYGSVFIAILALYLTLPLASGQTPAAIALDRWIDTVVAVLIALALIRLVGPRFTPALAKESIRCITRASLRVLNRTLSRQDFTAAEFVEDRRRLQYGLLRSGQAAEMATPSAAARAASYLRLERACAWLGYLILGSIWPSVAEANREGLIQARERYSQIATVRLDDPATAEHCDELVEALSDIFRRTGHA